MALYGVKNGFWGKTGAKNAGRSMTCLSCLARHPAATA